ncbi:TRAP transporter small permease [Arthrobacter roseus]|uniref:TRAP transporter small permease n=1 Tax=Arthrobacter roseus TaxID=136274 RepID=UPI001965EAF9|nr:TRAP transporter small permease [Arthrobacter roseus]MBM7847833.1 C4-dicarboxylate transporter DctQ subunit [Arthrobacter roseus]
MKQLRSLDIVENTLAVATFSVISIVAFANVLSRYLLNASLAFTTELTVNLAVLLTMVGAAIGIRESSHLGFTLLRDKATGRTHQAIVVLCGLAIVLFYAALFKFGLDISLEQFGRHQTTPALGLPKGLLSAALPLGALLGVIRAVQATIVGVGSAPKNPTATRMEA